MCKDNHFRGIRRRQKLSIQDEKQVDFFRSCFLFSALAILFDFGFGGKAAETKIKQNELRQILRSGLNLSRNTNCTEKII